METFQDFKFKMLKIRTDLFINYSYEKDVAVLGVRNREIVLNVQIT